jgi:hypothetical protein
MAVVVLEVHLRCFGRMMHRVMVMGVGQVRMVSRFLVGPCRVVRGGLVVMVCRVGVMLGGFAMMLCSFFGHVHSLVREPINRFSVSRVNLTARPG